MLRLQEMVPDYYIENSRDFQVLCRIFDYTLNALSFNIGTMQSLTDTKSVKDTALPLVGDKFGIYDEEAYTNRELLSSLPIAVQHKGSLKAIHILLNAFLDSMNIFSYAVAYHTKDKESAEEISSILNREVQQYSVIIVLSSTPSLTNLRVLDTYLKMVVPCGLIIEYAFGVTKTTLDKFKYSDNVFLFYTKGLDVGYVKGNSDKYYVPTTSKDDFIKSVTEDVDINTVGGATIMSSKQISDYEDKVSTIEITDENLLAQLSGKGDTN